MCMVKSPFPIVSAAELRTSTEVPCIGNTDLPLGVLLLVSAAKSLICPNGTG